MSPTGYGEKHADRLARLAADGNEVAALALIFRDQPLEQVLDTYAIRHGFGSFSDMKEEMNRPSPFLAALRRDLDKKEGGS